MNPERCDAPSHSAGNGCRRPGTGRPGTGRLGTGWLIAAIVFSILIAQLVHDRVRPPAHTQTFLMTELSGIDCTQAEAQVQAGSNTQFRLTDFGRFCWLEIFAPGRINFPQPAVREVLQAMPPDVTMVHLSSQTELQGTWFRNWIIPILVVAGFLLWNNRAFRSGNARLNQPHLRDS